MAPSAMKESPAPAPAAVRAASSSLTPPAQSHAHDLVEAIRDGDGPFAKRPSGDTLLPLRLR